MRVTSRMLIDSSLARLQDGQRSLQRQQERISSGKEIRRPSDDPSGASRILSLQADLRAREQEARNADDAGTLLSLADSSLQSVVERLLRARDLVVAGASEQQNASRGGMATEIAGIRDEIAQVANTRHDGRPLFSGFADVDAVQNVAGTWSYLGDAGEVRRRVGEGDFVVANVTAETTFGFDGGPGQDLFSTLDNVEAAMLANDQAALSGLLTDIDRALQSIGNSQARIGAAANRVEAAQTRNIDAQLALRTELSMVQDTDMANAIMEMQLQQTSYEATLSVLGRSLPTSLVAFLR